MWVLLCPDRFALMIHLVSLSFGQRGRKRSWRRKKPARLLSVTSSLASRGCCGAKLVHPWPHLGRPSFATCEQRVPVFPVSCSCACASEALGFPANVSQSVQGSKPRPVPLIWSWRPREKCSLVQELAGWVNAVKPVERLAAASVWSRGWPPKC